MTTANEFKEKGNAALSAGDIKEAIEHYSSAVALDPSNHVFYSNRSAAYCKAEEYEKALDDAEECIKINPKWGKGWTRKATALEFLGRNVDALEAYDKGLEVDPDNKQLREGRANAARNFSRSGRSQPSMFGGDAWAKLESDPRTKDFVKDPSFRKTLESLQKNPNDIVKHLGDPRIQAALSVIMGFDLSTAGASAGGDDGGPPPRHRAWGDDPPARPKPQKHEEPMETAEPELSDDQKESLRLKDLGNAAYKSKKFDEALEHYAAAFAKDPSNMSILTNQAAVFFEKEDYDQCVAKCEEAIEVGREHRADFKLIAKAFARIGNAYLKKDEKEAAIKFFQKSLSEFRAPDIVKKVQQIEKQMKEEKQRAYIDPAKAEEERQQGNECFTKGDYPGAVKSYTEALRRNPDDPKIYSNRAAAYSKLMEFNLALKDCDHCIELDPQFIKGHIRKGHICIALKNPQKASDAFEKALEIDAKNQEAIDGYRQAMMAINSDPEAVRRRAMQDPEVQNIMADPAMRMILEQMQREPGSLQDHLKNPAVAQKLRKLIEAGLIAIR